MAEAGARAGLARAGQGRRRRVAGLAAILVVAGAAACRDDRPPPATAPVPAALSVNSVEQLRYTSTDWNVYTADQVIESEGGYEGFDRPDSYRSIVYSVRRTLEADNSWSTVMELAQRLPAGPLPTDDGELYGYDIARIESSDTHAYFRVYDRSGALLPTSIEPMTLEPLPEGIIPYVPPNAQPMPEWPDTNQPPPPSDTGCTTPASCEGIEPQAAGTGSSAVSSPPPRSAPRTWLDPIVVTPAARARTRARIRSRFGESRRMGDGRERYARTLGSSGIELVLDPRSGAVVEENRAENGVLRSHIRHQYREAEPGVFVRHSTRIELATGRPGERPRVITTTLSNVRLGRLSTSGEK